MASLEEGGEPVLVYQAGYGYKERKHVANHFRLGEGLVGQCAQEKERILLTDVPADYIRINSGLGAASPSRTWRSSARTKRSSSPSIWSRRRPSSSRSPRSTSRSSSRTCRMSCALR